VFWARPRNPVDKIDKNPKGYPDFCLFCLLSTGVGAENDGGILVNRCIAPDQRAMHPLPQEFTKTGNLPSEVGGGSVNLPFRMGGREAEFWNVWRFYDD
jgi:hypothetical protein